MKSSEVFVHGLHVEPPWSIVDQFIELEKYPNEVHVEVSADQHQLYPWLWPPLFRYREYAEDRLPRPRGRAA